MQTRIALPELNAPATLLLDREHRLTDDEYWAFCVANPDLNIELTSEGEIVILPPPGAEADYRTVSSTAALGQWARMDGRGKAFGPSAQFLLPLGWLIDGDARHVYVYGGNSEPRIVADAGSIAGEGPVEGFVLQLEEIWEGL
jgi:Uma2 family endonuclease